MSWERGCGRADDYTIHEGDLALLQASRGYTHGSRVCSDSGADLQEAFAAGAGDRYYLVVPRTATGIEGGYGQGRPPGPDVAVCGLIDHQPGECP